MALTIPSSTHNCVCFVFFSDLNNNKISSTIEDIHGAFNGLVSLQSLTLDNNHIRTIPKQAFTGLERLKELSLNSNNITQIQGNAFDWLPELTQL